MADLGGSTYSLRIKAVLDTSDINAQLNRVGRSVQNGRGRVGAGGGAVGADGGFGGQLAAINTAQSLALTGSVGRALSVRAEQVRAKIIERVLQNRIKNTMADACSSFNVVYDGAAGKASVGAVQRRYNEMATRLESAQKRSTEAIQQETAARKESTKAFSKATLVMAAFHEIVQAADRAMSYWAKSREPIQQDLFRGGRFAQLHADIAATNLSAAGGRAGLKIAGGAATGAVLGSVVPGLGTAAGAAAGATLGAVRGAGDIISSYFDTKEKMNEYNQLLRESIQSTSSSYEFEKSVRELEASVRKNMSGDLGGGILSVREKIADLERRVYEKQGEQYGYGKTIEPYGVHGNGVFHEQDEEWIIASQNYVAAGNAIEEMREKIQQYNIVLGKLEKEEVKHKADLLLKEEKAVDKFTDVMTERSLDFKALTSLGERGLHATANLQTAQSIYSQCSKIVDILTKIEQKEGGIVWR